MSYFDDMFKTQNEATKQLSDTVERIYVGWINKDYRLDSDKAVKTSMSLTMSRYEKNWMGREVRRERKNAMTLADMFSNAITDYGRARGHAGWGDFAESLIRAYRSLETYGCIIDGAEEEIRKLNGTVKAREEEIGGLKQQLQSQERRLRDEEEEGRKKDNRIGYLENILIKNRISFGSEFSGVA